YLLRFAFDFFDSIPAPRTGIQKFFHDFCAATVSYNRCILPKLKYSFTQRLVTLIQCISSWVLSVSGNSRIISTFAPGCATCSCVPKPAPLMKSTSISSTSPTLSGLRNEATSIDMPTMPLCKASSSLGRAHSCPVKCTSLPLISAFCMNPTLFSNSWYRLTGAPEAVDNALNREEGNTSLYGDCRSFPLWLCKGGAAVGLSKNVRIPPTSKRFILFLHW